MNNTNIYTNDIPFYNMAYIIDAVIKLSLSVLFSLIISIERELHSHPGGAATHTLVGLASCLFTMISVKIQDTHSIDTADPARICAQIISGMGFLGSATIYKSNNYSEGEFLVRLDPEKKNNSLFWPIPSSPRSSGYILPQSETT